VTAAAHSDGRLGAVEEERFRAIDRDYVRAWLEDAGKTLIQLGKSGCFPQGHASNMPEPLQEFWLAYATDEARAGFPRPSKDAIDRMDRTLPWLGYVGDARKRRIVAARMLLHPLSEKPLFSYGRISREYDVSRSTAKQWHEQGLSDIAVGLMRAGRCGAA
jgi:hypothetical protein